MKQRMSPVNHFDQSFKQSQINDYLNDEESVTNQNMTSRDKLTQVIRTAGTGRRSPNQVDQTMANNRASTCENHGNRNYMHGFRTIVQPFILPSKQMAKPRQV